MTGLAVSTSQYDVTDVAGKGKVGVKHRSSLNFRNIQVKIDTAAGPTQYSSGWRKGHEWKNGAEEHLSVRRECM